jgi:Tol biopolymer transport system component
MDYLDFDLEIGPGSGRDYSITVRSLAGEVREKIQFPFDELALENRLKDIQIALLRSSAGSRQILLPEEQAVQNFGQALFEFLIPGEARSLFDQTRQRAVSQSKGVRIRLRFVSPELAVLPWEYLYDPRQREYISLSRNTPIIRYIEKLHPVDPLTVKLPLRILGMIAGPRDLPPLDVDQEKQRIERAIASLRARRLVELSWLEGQTWRDLQRAMRSGPWHIFHFIGHGMFDRTTDQGMIALVEEDGNTDRLYATQLARLLADHSSLRLVVLNACQGGQGSVQDIFSSTAAILVTRGLPSVLAMQYSITDRAAIELARSFYEALADGVPVDAAVVEARKAISLAIDNTLEWGTPVLFMRSSDGVLFKIRRETEEEKQSWANQEKDRQERLAREKAEDESLAIEKTEEDPRAEEEPQAHEKTESKQVAAEIAKQDDQALSTAKEKQIARMKADQERLVSDKTEADRSTALRVEQERADAERAVREKVWQERLLKQKTEAKAAKKHKINDWLFLGIIGAGLIGVILIGINFWLSSGWPWQNNPDIFTDEATPIEKANVLAVPTETIEPAPQTANLQDNETSTPELQPQPVPTGRGDGKIAFVSKRDDINNIYLMNADGSRLNLLTDNPSDDALPAWSPDGNEIAFSTNRDGNFELYKMKSDGSEVTRLTSSFGDDYSPAWSPSGNRIAFHTYRDGNFEIYVINADGFGETRLTNNLAIDADAVWSPDGNKIAFATDRRGNFDIFVMNADGSNETRLTDDPADDTLPAWSLKNNKIAFSTNRDGNFEIYVMNADGSEVKRLTENSANDTRPAWAPDGSKIAFVTDRDGNLEVYLMNLDGSEVNRLTEDPADDWGVAWQP